MPALALFTRRAFECFRASRQAGVSSFPARACFYTRAAARLLRRVCVGLPPGVARHAGKALRRCVRGGEGDDERQVENADSHLSTPVAVLATKRPTAPARPPRASAFRF